MDKFLQMLDKEIEEQQIYLDEARKDGSNLETKIYFRKKRDEIKRIRKMAEVCFSDEY